MSPTLDVFRCLLVSYASDGLTNDLYACSLTEVEPMFKGYLPTLCQNALKISFVFQLGIKSVSRPQAIQQCFRVVQS
jgi:hypothetical protein